MQRQLTGKFISAVAFLSALGAALGSSGPVYAAQETTEVAFVEDMSGRVVAFSQGKPILLETLDTINDRTQLDVLANSELQICHYQTRQLVTLKGPLRASVSRDGVAIENRKTLLVSAVSCAAPAVSKFQGGLVVRGVGTIPVNDVPGKR
jgi:hypothetical protein